MAAAVADFRPGDDRVGQDQEGRGRAAADRAGADRGRARRPARRPAGRARSSPGSRPRPGTTDDDWLEHGRRKLARKGADLLVVNPVGDGLAFEQKENSGVVLTADGGEVEIPPGPKASLAATVWDLVAARLG